MGPLKICEPVLLEILGPEAKDLVTSADPVHDKNIAIAFAAKVRMKNSISIDPKKSTRATLIVRDQDWPFPVPLIKKGGKWSFNSKEGIDELLYRRIGANELDAIQNQPRARARG